VTLSARRKRPIDRKVEHLRDTRLVVIATEGKNTEEQYFSQFRSTRVQVKVLPTGDDNRSSPERVLQRLQSFKQEFELAEDDQLWLMVDVDAWGYDKLKQVAREARSSGFLLAVSNPCFEVWLLFHHCGAISAADKCSTIESQLRDSLGGSYNKSKLRLEQFIPHVEQAVMRARDADEHPNARWPLTTGTHVYQIVANLPTD
jgi:hypothetical protein